LKSERKQKEKNTVNIYYSDAAREMLRSRGITAIDAEPTKLTAREKLEHFRRNRPRTFETPAEANEADHTELQFMNQMHREFYRQ
jgi:hypothetical protein